MSLEFEDVRRILPLENVEIELRGFSNPDELRALEKYITLTKQLIPLDYRSLVFIKVAQTSSELMEVHIEDHYRIATVFVYPHFYAQSLYMQLETLVHELVHLHHVPVFGWVKESVLSLFEDRNPELYNVLMTEFENRCERFVEDFGMVLMEFDELENLDEPDA